MSRSSLIYYICIFGTLTCLNSCQFGEKRSEDDLLAEVKGEKLYIQDISSSLSKAFNKTDSLFILNREVDTWVMEQIQYQEAKSTIRDKEDIKALTADYERSLYVNAFEKQILSESLDTLIENEEIDSFYKDHMEEFILQETIARCIMIKIPLSMDGDSIQELWKTEDIPALKAFVNSNDNFHILDLERWYYRSTLKNIMPEALYRKIAFTKSDNYTLQTDESKYYVKILEIAKAKETAPVSFVKERIKHRILQERIKSVLNTRKTQLYNEKIKSKAIKIYTKSSE